MPDTERLTSNAERPSSPRLRQGFGGQARLRRTGKIVKRRWNFTFQGYQSLQTVTEENEGSGEKPSTKKCFYTKIAKVAEKEAEDIFLRG
jgi:hypothetical protein